MEHLAKSPGFFNSIDTLIFDCDGVLWDAKGQIINGSAEIVTMLQALGKRIFLITNSSSKTRQQYVDRCTDLGFNVSEDNIVCTAWLLATYLKDVLKHEGKIYIVGGAAMDTEFKKKGLDVTGTGVESYGDVSAGTSTYFDIELDPDVNAVAVGFDPYINYVKNVKAMSYLQRPSCLFVATNTDTAFPTSGPIKLPGAGSMVKFVSTSAGREPIVVGKPSPLSKDILEAVHGKFDSERTLMVGDRLDTDIIFGRRCGFKTLLVLSGVSSLADVEIEVKTDESRSSVPDYYIETVGHFKPLLVPN